MLRLLLARPLSLLRCWLAYFLFLFRAHRGKVPYPRPEPRIPERVDERLLGRGPKILYGRRGRHDGCNSLDDYKVIPNGRE